MDNSGGNRDPKLIREAERRLAAEAAREEGARLAVEEAEAAVDAAIEAARHLDIPWVRISELTGLTEGQLKWRWHRSDPSVAEYNERRRLERARSPQARPGPRAGRGPGVGVSEAARQEGVTRKTIYSWVEKGEVEATQNELGETRILTRRDGSRYDATTR